MSHEDGSLIMRFQFQLVFRYCLLAVGVWLVEYRTHSFHIGPAMKASRAGLSNAEAAGVHHGLRAMFAPSY